MATGFIGGNLEDMETSAAVLDDTGAAALVSGTEAGTQVNELSAAVGESTNLLVSRFTATADGLRSEIGAAHSRLEATDWSGHSRDRAVEIKVELQAEIDRVLAAATDMMNAEKQAFVSRADELVSTVEQQFTSLMQQSNDRYLDLARAARATRDNFASADQTIA
jgi:hypothetical protein